MANLLFKRIKDWAKSITAFRKGDVIPVDGPSGTAKMSKDDLLRVTAENVSASGIVATTVQREADKESVKKGFTKTTSSDYTSYTGIPARESTTWYSGDGAKHIAIPLIAGQRISVTPSKSTTYVFCDSSYVAGDKTKGATLEVSSRNKYRKSLLANTKTTFIANSDDAYLILVVVDGDGVSVSFDIEIDNELRLTEILENGIGKAEVGYKQISQSDFMEYNGSLSSSSDTFYYNISKGKHIDIPVVQNCVYVVTPDRNVMVAVTGSSYIVGDKSNDELVNYATGRSRVLVGADHPMSFVTKDTDKYLVLNTLDGAGNSITWKIEQYFVFDKSAKSDVVKSSSDFTPHSGVPLKGIAKWYVANGCKHIAIPLHVGEIVSITPNDYVNYVFVTSSYIEGDQTNESEIYVSSRNKARGTIEKGHTTTFIANSDDAYLILNVVDGDGISITSTIEYRIFGDYDKGFNIDAPVKIKFGTWNIGHFSMGTDSVTKITPEDKASKQLAFRELLNSLNLDVLGVCEDDIKFCTDGTRSDVAIYPLFNRMSKGTKHDYNCNSLYHNLGEPINDEFFFYKDASQERYLHELEFVIKGKRVIFAVTHLELNEADRTSEINELITRYSDYDYVVIAGDFNTVKEATEFQPFLNAGYKLALMDYMPAIVTYPGSNRCIDNIVTKGFAISNVVVHNDSSALSDHLLVSCDLTML